LDRRLGEPQGPSGHWGVEKHSLSLPGIVPRTEHIRRQTMKQVKIIKRKIKHALEENKRQGNEEKKMKDERKRRNQKTRKYKKEAEMERS
jgi:hypothetical protein